MTVDVSERWALSSEGLELLLDAAVEACVLMEADGRVVGWNQAAETMFGWTAGEVVGVEMVGLLLSEGVREEYGMVLERLLASGSRVATRFELRAVRRDGVQVLIEVGLCVVDSGPRPRIAALMIDVSDRKGAAARQRQFEAIVASSGDAILSGPFDRTLESWNPAIVGEHIIAGTPGLSHLAPAMRAEHERWDGGGYPDGLARESIPLASRITLACDALNAMTSDRPYRPAMTIERARQELQANAGTQFDPAVIEALLAQIATRPQQPQDD